MLSDPEQIAVIAVARAEELAVTETGALRSSLRERMGLPLERVVANALGPRSLQPARGDDAGRARRRIPRSRARCAVTSARCASARSSRG